jgi:hypothetical protein
MTATEGTVPATYRRGRLVGDYRGAHTLLPDGHLAEVVRVEYIEWPVPGYFATLRHLNYEPIPGRWNMGSLRFLDRTWTP